MNYFYKISLVLSSLQSQLTPHVLVHFFSVWKITSQNMTFSHHDMEITVSGWKSKCAGYNLVSHFI